MTFFKDNTLKKTPTKRKPKYSCCSSLKLIINISCGS